MVKVQQFRVSDVMGRATSGQDGGSTGAGA
jgi:hypothetical protein